MIVMNLPKIHEKYVVARLSDFQYWYWGDYSTIERAVEAIKDFKNAFIFEIPEPKKISCNAMSPEEFERRMKELSERKDVEFKHIYADEMMCEVLKSLGYGNGVRIFETMDKWYS